MKFGVPLSGSPARQLWRVDGWVQPSVAAKASGHSEACQVHVTNTPKRGITIAGEINASVVAVGKSQREVPPRKLLVFARGKVGNPLAPVPLHHMDECDIALDDAIAAEPCLLAVCVKGEPKREDSVLR